MCLSIPQNLATTSNKLFLAAALSLGLSGSAFAQSTPISTNGNVQGSGTTSTGAAGQQATGMTRPVQSTTEVNGASIQPGSTMTGTTSGTTTNGTRKTRSGKSGRGKMKVKTPR